MAISVRASGTWAAATTQSPSYAIPAGYQAGDLGILVSGWKPYTVSATVNQDWTEIIDEAAGSTANGNGTGSSRVYVAYKVLGSSETNPTVTRSGSVSPGGGVIIVLQKSASESWDVAALSAAVEQAMANTSMSHNLTTTAAIASADLVFALTVVGDDSSTFTRATTAISGGPSWSGNVVEYPATHLSDTAGNDMAADLIYRVASSSVASGQTITVTATLSAAERVSSVLFRVRVNALEEKSGSFTITGGGIATNVAAKGGQGAVTATGGGVSSSAATSNRQLSAAVTGGGVATVGAEAWQPEVEEHDGSFVVTGGGSVTAGSLADRLLALGITGGGSYTQGSSTTRSGITTATGGGAVTADGTKGAGTSITATGGGAVTSASTSGRSASVVGTGGGTATTGITSARQAGVAGTGGGSVTVQGSTAEDHAAAFTVTGGGAVTVGAEVGVRPEKPPIGPGRVVLWSNVYRPIRKGSFTVSGGGSVTVTGVAEWNDDAEVLGLVFAA